MIRTVLAIAACLLLVGFAEHHAPEQAADPVANPHGQRMMIYHRAMDASVPAGAAIFLGDSITQGLATAAVAPYSVNYGIGSATTGELLDNLPVYKSLRRAGAVFLLIGINDIGRGQTIGLEGRLQAIADAIPAGVPLVWSAIMPAYVDRADPEAIRQANRAIARTCAARPGCVYVDTGALSDAALFSDGVHPNTAGYAVWIGALRDAYAKVVPNA